MNRRFHTTLATPVPKGEDYNLEDMARNVGSARRISYDDSALHTGSFSNICSRVSYIAANTRKHARGSNAMKHSRLVISRYHVNRTHVFVLFCEDPVFLVQPLGNGPSGFLRQHEGVKENAKTSTTKLNTVAP